MILSVSINNYKAINNEVTLSFEGEPHIKRLNDNLYISESGFTSLKSLGIFGPNNVGKSCLLECLSLLKMILSGRSVYIPADIFSSEKKITELGITFLYKEKVYSYTCKYDSEVVEGESAPVGFIYEKLSEIEKGSEKRNKETTLFKVDVPNDKYIFKGNSKVAQMLRATSRERSALFSLNPSIAKEVKEYQDICKGFSDTLEVFRSERVPLTKTIEIFKRNDSEAKLLKALITAADLGISDFGYLESSETHRVNEESPLGESPTIDSDDAYRLYSTKAGDVTNKRVPFLSVDSTGTRKVIALLGYIEDALINDKTIVIDELGNSLHIGLCTAIISMFNSELNHKGQLLFTSHETALLDTSILFRKDQIWFLSKEEGKEYLYSLSDFNAGNDGARPTSNNAEKYRLGQYGAIPKINIYSALADIEANRPDSIQNSGESSDE